MLYISEELKKSNKSLKDFVQSIMRSSWQALPSQEKEKYVTMRRDLKKQYEVKLGNWERKMIDQGHINVVRRATVRRLKPKVIKDNSEQDKGFE